MLTLGSDIASVRINPSFGGRVAGISIRGREMLVDEHDPSGETRGSFQWGIFPMVPFAGRVRDGEFVFAGVRHRLPRRMAPHAIHGTVDDLAWRVADKDSRSVVMTTPLGAAWPFDGDVTHHIQLTDSSLRLELSVVAAEQMPVQVGWHPWFRRPVSVSGEWTAWLPRDSDGMPTRETSKSMPTSMEDVDDCFVTAAGTVRIEVAGLHLRLTSDCSHWVVYSRAAHGVCVEPQSGPPNEINVHPTVLAPGQRFSRWFEIAW